MNAIKELLEQSGKMQKELQLAVGVSQPTVSEWVRNKKDPSKERLEKVAAFFGVDWRVVKCLAPIPSHIGKYETSEQPFITERLSDKEMEFLQDFSTLTPSNRRILFALSKILLQEQSGHPEDQD